MSVYKPKNSPFFHYDFRWKGHRFHGSTGQTARRNAESVERSERARAALGKPRRPELTLDLAAERYTQEVAAHQASAKTTDYQLANLVTGLGKTAMLSEIAALLPGYIARRRGQSAHGRGNKLVANATVNREVALLRSLYRRAQRVWRVDVGEAPDWGAHMLPEAEERVRSLTQAQEAALFEHLRPDFHPLVRFALATGLRLGNIIRLTWAQVDWDAAEIAVTLKGRAGRRRPLTIRMTPGLVDLLSAERGRHPIFVFTYLCRRGRAKRLKGQRYPFSRYGWRGPWNAALEAAGIADFRFHDLRHTDATRTLRKTRNLKLVQQKLGHASITSTARYSHVTVDDVHSAMLAMEVDAAAGPTPDAPQPDSESRNSPGAAPRRA